MTGMTDSQNSNVREIDPGEIRAIIHSLREQGTDEGAIPKVLENMGIPKEQAKQLVLENKPAAKQAEPVQPKPAPQTNYKEEEAKKHGIRPEDVGDFFEVPKEVVEFPSQGLWYPNNKSSITIKHLTATDDDILYDTDLIQKNQQLQAILESSIVDKDLRPEDMLTCDRNYVLIRLRMTGLGADYEVGLRSCGNCGHIHNASVDLSKLKLKPINEHPDERGEFSMSMQHMKAQIKFRLLTGQDEFYMNKQAFVLHKKGKFNIKNTLREKYLLHIMEVNGKRDKIYIRSYINAMPMLDSKALRDRISQVEPGLVLEYDYKCPECGAIETKPVPISNKLFYPDIDL